MEIPFIGAAYQVRSSNVNAQRCVNLIPESGGYDGKSILALYGTPGLELFVNLGGYPVRGTHVVSKTHPFMYIVTGSTFKKVNPSGVDTVLGTLLTATGFISMEDNGTQIMIVDGNYGYIYTIATGAFAQISDPDFPGGDTVTFLDGYFIVNKPGTGSFQLSSAYDGTAWAALDIKTAESHPDNLIAVISDKRELWAFGEETVEVFYNDGTSTPPMRRMNGVTIDKGLAAAACLTKFDNSLAWLTNEEDGGLQIVRADGYQPRRISTDAIDYAISTYSAVSDAFCYSYIEAGHEFLVVTFPSGNQTWVYDANTKLWHERSSYGLGRHRANSYARFAGSHMVGDHITGKIYKMKMDTYTDNGDPIERIRRVPHFNVEAKNLFYHELQIDIETGTGNLNYTSSSYVSSLADGSFLADGSILAGGTLIPGGVVNPQAMLRWSDDGGHLWSNEHWREIGKRGAYGKRVKWSRMGRSRGRIFELKITDPIKVVLIAAYAEITSGR